MNLCNSPIPFRDRIQKTDKRKHITASHRSWRLLDLEMDKTVQTCIGTNLPLAPSAKICTNRLALTDDNLLTLHSKSTNQ
jgi:hypothetical protein